MMQNKIVHESGIINITGGASGIFLQGIGEYEAARTVRQRNGIVDLKEVELCRSWIRDHARPVDFINRTLII